MSAPVLPHRTRGNRTVFAVLALIAVFGTLLYLLRDPARRQWARLQPQSAAVVASDPAQVTALQAQVNQLQARVGALEQKMAARAAAPVAAPAPAAPVVALPAPGPGADPLVLALSGRMDGLSTQIAAVTSTLKADEARLEAAGNQADTVTAVSERVARLARIAAAAAALESGTPLSDMPNMPPALARFRGVAPPTEAQLRLAFPAVAARARAATRPDTAGLGFWGAMKARAEGLITVRRGDDVLLGSSALGVLDRARAALDAGDLAGAVTILGGLQGPAAAAVAAWRSQAQTLLDARAALAKLASQA
jgi:hypothetical protein